MNSKLVDETINSCSNIPNSSVSETINCGSNLSTLQINEEYNQRKNVKKRLDEELADVRKKLYENYDVLNQITSFCIIATKTPPITLTPSAKGSAFIAGHSMLHEIDENRIRSKTEFG